MLPDALPTALPPDNGREGGTRTHDPLVSNRNVLLLGSLNFIGAASRDRTWFFGFSDRREH